MPNENEPLIQDFLWDAHTHYLEQESFPDSHINLVNTVTERDFEPLAHLYGENRRIFPFFGLHPWFLREASGNWEAVLEGYLKRFAGAGVGETGLDKVAADKGKALPLKEQEFFFRRQLEISLKYQRPVAIHCVGAWGLMIEIVEELYPPRVEGNPVLFHGYQGSRETALRLLKRGVFFSFCLEALEERGDLIKGLPLEHILLETDGRKGKERYLKETYFRLAALLGIKIEELITRIGMNGAIFTGYGFSG